MHPQTISSSLTAMGMALVIALGLPAGAHAITAPIHIHGTAPEGRVNIRPQPNTAQAAIGSIPEGASPDYNCFTYGEVVGSVPVWFSVNWGGVTGFYASFYDDSSYGSEQELTAKYGVPKCGATAAPVPSPQPVTSPQPAAPSPQPATVNPQAGAVSPQPQAAPSPPLAPAPVVPQQSLPPDADLWCVTRGGQSYATGVRESDWKVQFDGLSGDRGSNNWRCRFLVSRRLPSGRGETYALPPRTEYVNIDFAQACAEQYPGSTLHFMYGPIYSTPWPWECLAPGGVYYPPPETNLLAMSRAASFRSGAIQTDSAATISVSMAGASASVRGASAARTARPVLARGRRKVTGPGRYEVRVLLTRAGRRAVRRAHRLRTVFEVRIKVPGQADRVLRSQRTLRR